MGARNLSWYNANETRAYPLSDAATLASTAGKLLPSNILADLNLRYPNTLGDYPFLASMTVNANIVSITLQCCADLTDITTFAPLAVFTMPRKQVTPGLHYPLSAQYPGVGGWVVFGDGLNDEPYTGRFMPAAGLLAARAARGYRPLPVSGLSKIYNDTTLTGVVNLVANAPLEAVAEQHEIDGVLRDVVMIRLVQPITTTNNATNTTDNVFETMSGPCGNRPESGNCGNWNPLQAINAVQPDCNGNITIEFQGCAIIAKVLQECGVVIDCPLGLSTACLPPSLPTSDGLLPNEYPDQCGRTDFNFSASIVYVPPIGNGGPGGGTLSTLSESIDVIGELPYTYTFDASAHVHWKTLSGAWGYSTSDSPGNPGGAGKSYSTEFGGGPSFRNVTLWEGFDHSTLHRSYTFDLMLTGGASNHNGGLVLNYKPSGDFSGTYTYFLVEIDYESQQFRVMYFNGNSWIAEPAFVQLQSIWQNTWYRINVQTTPSGGGVAIVATLGVVNHDGTATTIATTSETSNKFLPDVGAVGFHANRAATRFSYLTVEAI